ncbi:hypothetical protein L218DRAFT_961968 [Marasmius fiardii PR-910]|nr:hypothetical protein L218DRAFT_961968 [Marasmius fiardii PR-910]
MPGLQILIIPLALAIVLTLFTQRRPKGPGNLPPGPPGRDLSWRAIVGTRSKHGMINTAPWQLSSLENSVTLVCLTLGFCQL